MNVPRHRFACLPPVNEEAARIADINAHWRRVGALPEWRSTVTGRSYLRFALNGQDHAHGLVDAQAWAQVRMPSLAAIGWDSVTDDMAERLISDVADPLRLSMPDGMPAPTARCIGLFRPATVERLPMMPSLEGDALIQGAWRWPAATSNRPLPWRGSISVRFHVGHTRLKRQVLSRVGPGDVLLLHTRQCLATTGPQALFSFSLGQEGLIVDEFINVPVEPDYLDAETGASDRVELDRVPLRVDVVLAQRSFTLEELAGWAPGSIIALDPTAWASVQLRIDGMLFATGELVQAGDGLAVQVGQLAPR
jgi:flagellar motor switch/type III secretory pathway protein FliN